MNSRKELVDNAERRTREIDEYIANNSNCDTKMVYNAFQSEKIEAIKVYEIPRNMLRLNPNNGRFRTELDIIQKERQELGKPIELDPDNEEDSQILQSMIKGEYPPSKDRKRAYKILKDNICEIAQKTATNGQEVPGIITHDGILVNGNRRWVIMEDLAEITRHSNGQPLQFNTLRVARLKKSTDSYAIWKNEAKEQISQESREEYDYVNSALEIKRGYQLLINQNMSDQKAKAEITKTLYGRTKNDVDDYLEFLEIADLFLEAIGKNGQYTYVQDSGSEDKGIVTILRDISKERKRYVSDMDPENVTKWFTAACAFTLFSKEKPEISSDDGITKKLSFGHRDYRTFQKKIMSQSNIRKKFLDDPIIEKINLSKPTTKDISDFYKIIRESQEEYDINFDINEPVSLLKKAKTSLSKVSQDLAGTHKKSMIKKIKDEKGLDHLKDIQSLIKEIVKSIKSS